MKKYKRIFRRFFSSKKRKKEISIHKMARIFTVLALIIFIATQLITNAVLSPLGHELQTLNEEKNELLEIRRNLEKDIASNTAVPVIKTYSKEKFGLKSDANSRTIYISDHTLQASSHQQQ
jgi:amino acid permease